MLRTAEAQVKNTSKLYKTMNIKRVKKVLVSSFDATFEGEECGRGARN